MKNRSYIICSYHKCLTVYYQKVFTILYKKILHHRNGFKHFYSYLDDFYQNKDKYRIVSINNHMLDFAKLGNFRIVRFIRDPRDLVVSGYFYHKRGTEPWCNIKDPKPEDWMVVNGRVPKEIKPGHSFSSYLNSLNQEDGLIAEIEFRKNHFQSMWEWPLDNPRIKMFTYKNIIKDEEKVFFELFKFFDFNLPKRLLGSVLANRYKIKNKEKWDNHVRNPEPSQWKKYFTPKVEHYFSKNHGHLLNKYNFSRE